MRQFNVFVHSLKVIRVLLQSCILVSFDFIISPTMPITELLVIFPAATARKLFKALYET